MTLATVYAHHSDGTVSTMTVDFEPGPAPAEPCPNCEDSLLAGVLMGSMIPHHGVIGDVCRCDECARYPGDLEAAAAVAFVLEGTAHYDALCPADDAAGAPADHAGCHEYIRTNTDPWVEV